MIVRELNRRLDGAAVAAARRIFIFFDAKARSLD
jgi:hypothetical protein